MSHRLRLAAGQHDDTSTRREAARLGVPDKELRSMIAAGQIRRLSRGVFAFGSAQLSVVDEHRLAARAVHRAYRGLLVASHQTALLLVGLPVHGVDLGQLRFQRRTTGGSLATRRLRIGRPTVRLPSSEVAGVAAVDPAYAVGQIAAEYGLDVGIVPADALLARDPTARDQIRHCHELMAGCSGRSTVALVAELADPRSESPGESLLRLILRVAGIEVIPQFEVDDQNGRFVARADFRVSATRALIEFDGRLKYTTPDALWAEKNRADRLVRLGWSVIRVIWADLSDPGALVRRIESELADARRHERANAPPSAQVRDTNAHHGRA